jgi:hypothetical protein
MKLSHLYLYVSTLFTCYIALAQIGITGTVIDGDFNEPLPFANILIQETGTGVTSDFDGKYSFELPAGTYSIQFSFVGYETKIITEVEVSGDEYTITDVVLNSAAEGLEEVVVTVEAKRNTEASVLQIQRKSASLLDGISAQAFKKLELAILLLQLKVFQVSLYKEASMSMFEV